MKFFRQLISTTNNRGLKALAISDLHIYDMKDYKKLEIIMDELKHKEYDVIYLVGDIIDSTNMLINPNSKICEQLQLFLRYLGYVAPTYIVYGNHDIGFYEEKQHKWISDYRSFEENFLNKIANSPGINVLDGETKELIDGYTISGFNPSFEYAYNKPDGDSDTLFAKGGFEFLNNLKSDSTNILLCHYPDVIKDLAKKGYLDKVDLGIAGHNHNGMTQFRFIPLEWFLNLLNANNRGLITPAKSIKLNDTENLRGTSKLNDRCTLIINPSITSLSACTGILRNFDSMFYMGATEVLCVPENNKELKRSKN